MIALMAIPSGLSRAAGLAVSLAVVGAAAIGERTRPLRRRTRETLPRLARNAAMGAACSTVIMVSEAPLTRAIARRNASRRRGIQHRLGGEIQGRMLAFLAADYGFYLWHVATHKVPFLWRFHRIHHVDPDLDMSTAIRFHFLDMLVSLPWRVVQVRVAGLDPRMLSAWQGFFLLSILFHHSNWRLPGRWDERLSCILTTPKMHGIHHSRVPSEMDSNWSSGISWWDYLHGTYRMDVAQENIVIGVDDPAAARDIRLLSSLAAPTRTGGDRDYG